MEPPYRGEVPLQSVFFKQASVELKKSDTCTLKVIFYPSFATNQHLIWLNGDTVVAKVDSLGRVTSLQPGETVVNIREMSERIQSTCTVHKSDVYAVLVALEDVVAEAIQNGEIVRLGDLCTLQVSLTGKGAITEEEHTASLIKRAKINFRPGTILANALASLNYSKVAIKYPKEEEQEEDMGDEGNA